MEEIGTAATHDAKISRLEARIESLEKNVSRMVDTVERLTGVVHRPQVTQWGWVISGVSVIIGTALAFTTLVTMPIKETVVMNAALQQTNNVRQEQRLNDLEQKQHDDGNKVIRTEALLEAHQGYDVQIHALMMQEVRDIDLYGSRRWVERNGDK